MANQEGVNRFMGTLLVVGAVNTDMVASVDRAPDAGETVLGKSFAEFGGGKGANQAVAAARSGATVALLSAVGNDSFGDARVGALHDEGIATNAISVFEDATSGIAIIVVDANGENRICDIPGAREKLDPSLAIQSYEDIRPVAILATNELPVDCLETLFRKAQADGIPIWFNVAPYSAASRSLIRFVDAIVVNRGEAEDILDCRGRGHTVDQLVQGLVGLGARRVVMTLGSDGVCGFDGEASVFIEALPVKAVDSTGAGDTFSGAWAAEMLRGSTFTNALSYANHAAAISVTRPGAQSSIPMRSEIEGG